MSNATIEVMRSKGKYHPNSELKSLSRATLSQLEQREKNLTNNEFVVLDSMDAEGKIDIYNLPERIWVLTFQRWLLRKYGLKWLVNYLKEIETYPEIILGRLQALGVSDSDIEAVYTNGGDEIINLKVAGVTFNNRQKALERLTHYAPEEILTVLVPEPENEFDKNAIAVKVLVKGAEKSYCIGYVPKTETAKVRPYISKFPELKIVRSGDSYGAELKMAV